MAQAELIKEIIVEGNGKVETSAIVELIATKQGTTLSKEKVQADILALYDINYFSDIRFSKESIAGGIRLVIEVKEKPAITSIVFSGMDEITEDDLKDSLETKLYTIVNEGTITSDMNLIEKKYIEKGFYLSRVSYNLNKKGENEVELIFHVDESGKVLVSDVFLLGNQFFADGDIIDKLTSKPYTRWSAGLGAPSMFQDANLSRDQEFITFYYKDFGFAEVKVAKPLALLDPDKHFVRVNFDIEEGLQYSVGSIKVSGDVGEGLYEDKDLIAWMVLKNDDLFRYSKFTKDIEMLVDKYGDLGYAYVDVDPRTKYDREKRLVHIDYHIAKGQKVYFGRMEVVGNTKTRDNVIRRELEVVDSELYSGTRLAESRMNVNRLGFFEEVQFLKERDDKEVDVLNLKIKVKEKPTGQLQMAVGYSPRGETNETFFGQGRYDEKNQSGYGINTNLTLKYGGKESYEATAGFYNPKVDDGPWSLGLNFSYQRRETYYTPDLPVPELEKSVALSVGRAMFEHVRSIFRVTHSLLDQLKNAREVELLEGSSRSGIKNSLSMGVSRRHFDNLIDPTEGSDVFLNQKFVGRVLGGDFQFQETSLDVEHYLPLEFGESFRTYFKTHMFAGQLLPWGSKDIPSSERYRLGGFNDLRGFGFGAIGPSVRRGLSVLGSNTDFNYGGNQKVYWQFEYFVPLIPQAGIKSLVFADIGKVYSEREENQTGFDSYSKDVGFGIRWMTPIAPFRFEWAYPYIEEKKSFGDYRFIFNIGY